MSDETVALRFDSGVQPDLPIFITRCFVAGECSTFHSFVNQNTHLLVAGGYIMSEVYGRASSPYDDTAEKVFIASVGEDLRFDLVGDEDAGSSVSCAKVCFDRDFRAGTHGENTAEFVG